MLLHKSLYASVFALSIALCCSAQDIKPSNDTGLRPLTPYFTGDGNVNLTNGNLNVRIPLVSLPGRNGLNYTLFLDYDSKMWSPHPIYGRPSDVHYTWTDDSLNSHPYGGWRLNRPTLQSGPSLTDGLGNHIGDGDYIMTLLDGSKHALGRTAYYNFTDWSRDAEDGSGLVINNPTSQVETTVIEKSGLTYDFRYDGLRVKDTNGNYILFDGNNVTDTAGRLISVTYNYYSGNQDTVSYKDSDGIQRTITLTYSTKPILVGPLDYKPFSVPTDSNCQGGGNIHICVIQPNNISKKLLTSVTLPDNTQYIFDYNNYGELSKIVYPTGGYVLYEYAAYQHEETYWQFSDGSCNSPDPCYGLNIQADFREVSKKTVCSTSDCAIPEITVYVPAVGGTSNGAEWVYEGVPSSDLAVPPTHYKRQTYTIMSPCFGNDVNFTRYCTPKTASEKVSDFDGTVLKLTTFDSYYTYGGYPLLPRSITTSYNGGPYSTEYLEYDTQTVHVLQPLGADYDVQTLQDITMPIDNVTTRTVYDYGQTTIPLRKEVNTYLKSYTNPYVHILDRKLRTQIYDGSNSPNPVADTQYDYDLPADGIVASGATNHDSSNGNRGNVTAIKRWRNTDGALLITKNRKLDDAGNVLVVEDPMGHQTQLFYDDQWSDSSCLPTDGKAAKAYLTKVIAPGPIQTQGKYKSCSGKVGEIIDANGQSSFYDYHDSLGRLTAARYPLGGSIAFTYPNPNTVFRSEAIATGVDLNHTIAMDGRGRITDTILTSDPQGQTTVHTDYDVLGRVYRVSNPYRLNDPIYYTTTLYDALDRPTLVTKPDGSIVQNAYNQNTTTVIDEALKQRKTTTDALGNLTQVLEPDLTGALNWQTNYSYNPLGDLLCVEQRGDAGTASGCSTPGYYGGPWRVRRFVYNSLSQLTTANNPESNSISYTYDDDGHVKTKTDANGTMTTFSYVNDRLTSKFYTPGSGVATTSPVNYTYDSTANGNFGIGRRTGMTDGSGNTSWFYDAKGRVSQIGHTISGYAKTFSYTYNLDDSVATIAYPSGRVLTYTPGGAGRPLRAFETGVIYVSGSCTDSAVCYTASGALSDAKLGANIALSNTYNPRLQPVTLSATVGANTIMSRTYDFVGNVTDNGETGNNGNVYGIADNLDPFNIASRPIGSMKFRYDKLNRLTSFSTTGTDCTAAGNASKNSGNSYTIDAWGNLTNKTVTKCTAEPLNQAVDSTNRFTPSDPSLGRYDAAGNLKEYGAYTFDAENRLVKLAGDSTPRYIYDGEGNRVAKPTTMYWLGADGSILAESNATGYIVSEYIFFNGKRIARVDLP